MHPFHANPFRIIDKAMGEGADRAVFPKVAVVMMGTMVAASVGGVLLQL